mgnify:CR=1 FL=1
MSNIKSILFYETVRPLKVTFSTSLGKRDVIKSVIVKVRLDNGCVGIGECPTSFVLKNETVLRIRAILNKAAAALIKKPASECQKEIKILRSRFKAYPMTISGLEVALFRACLASENTPEHKYWGGALTSLKTDITIPFIVDAVLLDRWLGYTKSVGFSSFKLKVSGDIEADKTYISRVYEKLKTLSDDFTIRLDGNQGFNEKSFLQLTDFVEKNGYKIELFEQPLPKDAYRGFTEIKKRSPIPIILDETVFTTLDFVRVIDENMCHGVNIKVAKSGVAESARIFSMAKQNGMKLMVGCMTETITGLSAGIYLALGTGGFDFIDLDAVHLLRHKKRYGNLLIDGPCYTINDC